MALVWTKKGAIGVSVLGGLLVASLGINFAVLPALDTISTATQGLSQTQTDVTSAENQLVSLQNVQNTYESVKTINDALTTNFPDTGETQILIENIIAGAGANGIDSDKITSVTFTAPTLIASTTEATEVTEGAPISGGFAELPFQLSVSGSPAQLEGFLNYLNKMDRVVLIEEASITSESEQYTLSFSATTYIYPTINEPQIINPDEILGEPTEEAIVEE